MQASFQWLWANILLVKMNVRLVQTIFRLGKRKFARYYVQNYELLRHFVATLYRISKPEFTLENRKIRKISPIFRLKQKFVFLSAFRRVSFAFLHNNERELRSTLSVWEKVLYVVLLELISAFQFECVIYRVFFFVLYASSLRVMAVWGAKLRKNKTQIERTHFTEPAISNLRYQTNSELPIIAPWRRRIYCQSTRVRHALYLVKMLDFKDKQWLNFIFFRRLRKQAWLTHII